MINKLATDAPITSRRKFFKRGLESRLKKSMLQVILGFQASITADRTNLIAAYRTMAPSWKTIPLSIIFVPRLDSSLVLALEAIAYGN